MTFSPSLQSLLGAHSDHSNTACVDWPGNRFFQATNNYISRYGIISGLEETFVACGAIDGGTTNALGRSPALLANGGIAVSATNTLYSGAAVTLNSALVFQTLIPYPSPNFGQGGMTGVVAGNVQYVVEKGIGNDVIPVLNRIQEISTTTWLAYQDFAGIGGVCCAGPAGSGTAYILSPDETGLPYVYLNKILFNGAGFVSNTLVRAIPVTDVNPAWGIHGHASAVCLDKTDGNLIVTWNANGVAPAHNSYVTKVNRITGIVEWASEIPDTDGGGGVEPGNIFSNSDITHQRVAFYTGSGPTVTIYNTSDGSVVDQYFTGLNGLFPTPGGQCYSDTLGGIIISCDFSQTTGSPTLLNSTPTSWGDSYAVLYVAAPPTPPPGSRRFLAHMGPVRSLHLTPIPPPPLPTNSVGDVDLDIAVTGFGISGSLGAISLDIAVAGVGDAGHVTVGTIGLDIAVLGVGGAVAIMTEDGTSLTTEAGDTLTTEN